MYLLLPPASGDVDMPEALNSPGYRLVDTGVLSMRRVMFERYRSSVHSNRLGNKDLAAGHHIKSSGDTNGISRLQLQPVQVFTFTDIENVVPAVLHLETDNRVGMLLPILSDRFHMVAKLFYRTSNRSFPGRTGCLVEPRL
jgi:hypothetical protein